MCGRFTHLFTWRELHDLMRLTTWPPAELQKRYNVAPRQMAPVVVQDPAAGAPVPRRAAMMRWGLVPGWAMKGAAGVAASKAAEGLINARAETARTKPTFRSAFEKRRCVVPVSGFYEWRTVKAPRADGEGPGGKGETTRKVPLYITLAGGGPMLLAGLWEPGAEPGAETFAILTCAPNDAMATVHDRMPVILNAGDAGAVDRWLDAGQKGEQVEPLLAPAPDGTLELREVGTLVNSVKNEGAELLEPPGAVRGREKKPEGPTLWG